MTTTERQERAIRHRMRHWGETRAQAEAHVRRPGRPYSARAIRRLQWDRGRWRPGRGSA